MTDQYTMQDPTKMYADISQEVQYQEGAGLDAHMTDQPDLGETTYRGSGRLEGRRALITGGDSGIGGATAIAFAREGADLVISYLPEEQEDADRIAALVRDAGRQITLVPGDIADADYCRELVAKSVEALGGLDIIVNNAGKQQNQDGIEDITDDQLVETYATNILSMFRIVKAALPHLKPGSSIINTTSIQAYNPSPTLIDYASTKAAINNFTKGLAASLGEKGIRVNAVAPGPIWTPLQTAGGQPPEELPTVGEGTWLGRWGQPAELAPAYVFLASNESSYVLGETLNVNGGMGSP